MSYPVQSALACSPGIVAVIAALREELAPLLSSLRAKKLCCRHKQKYYSSTIRGQRVILVRAGIGFENVTKALNFLNRISKPELVMNIGFAGALTGELEIGDVVFIKESIKWPECTKVQLKFQPISLQKFHGNFRTSPAVSLTVPRMVSKSKLSKLDVISKSEEEWVVDLETFHYARRCQDMEFPLVVVRSITDTLGDEFSFNLEEITDKSGHVDPLLAFRLTMQRPALAPHFWHLWRVSTKAATNLAKATISYIASK